MVGFLALAVLQIGLIIFSRMIAPRVRRTPPAPFEAPNVEDGAPIPRPFGIQQISGTVILLKDRITIQTHDDTRTEYYAKIAYGIGWGELDVLYDIILDERSLRLQVPGRDQSAGGHYPITTVPFPIELTGDAPVKFDVSALNMFGGGDEEGGINGEVCIYRGTDAQPLDPLIAYGYGEFASRFPHLAYIRFGTAVGETTTSAQQDQFYWISNNPAAKPISFIVGSYPHGLVDLALALGIPGYTDPRIGQNANPLEVIFECLVNSVWGKKEQLSIFNIPQWIAKAAQLRAENRGISTTLAGRELDDFIDDILTHIRGVLVENPETGLLEVTLLRNDYDPAQCVHLTKKNTLNFTQGEGHFLETLNQIEVKYKKFIGGLDGANTSVTTADFIYVPTSVGFPMVILMGFYDYQTSGRNLTEIVVTRDREGDVITLVAGVGGDYTVHAVDGWFHFISDPRDGRLETGDILTIDYVSALTFSGFVDETATAQNIANRLITGYTRSQDYDYPMFTEETSAQEMANFLRLMTSRKLALFEWDMTREGSHLKAGDVVIGDEPKFRVANYPIRITKVHYGTPESPELHFEGMKDVFAEAVLARIPSFTEGTPPPITQPPITATVLLQCLGGAIRIGLVSTDPTYNIEVTRYDDALGAGATVITPTGGVPSSTTYIDDPQTVGVTKWYQGRLIYPGLANGPLSNMVSCTASADPPTTPTDVLPTWEVIQSQTDVEGTATLLITDPQSRVTLVEWKSKVGTDAESAYVAFTVADYTATVLIGPVLDSIITFRITYYDLDGTLISVEVPVYFAPADTTVPPPTVPSAGAGSLCLPFHTILTRGAVARFLPAGVTELGQFSRRKVDLTGFERCQGESHTKYALPANAYVGFQWVSALNDTPSEDDWQWLDGDSGPQVRADTVTEVPDVSEIKTIALDARQPVTIRVVAVGGDGATQFDTKVVLLYLLGAGVGDEEPENPPEDTTCQETTDHFGGYTNTADMDANWQLDEVGYETGHVIWSLDPTGGPGGSAALKLTMPPGTRVFGFYFSLKSLLLEDLDPAVVHTMEADIKADYDFGTTSDGRPQISLRHSPLESGAGSVAATVAAHDDWEHVVFDATNAIHPNLDGTLYASCLVENGALSITRQIWFANVTVRDIDGNVINPCTSGPATPPTDPNDPNSEPLPPSEPPPATGIRSLGLWSVQSPYTQYPPFYGVSKSVQPSYIVSTLTALQALNYRAVLTLVGHNDAEVNGSFNLTKYLNSLSQYQGINLSSFRNMLVGFCVFDDIFSAKVWGLTQPVQWNVIDGSMGKATFDLLPSMGLTGLPLFVRASAMLLKAHGVRSPQYIRNCWNQWTGPGGDGQPDIASYMAANISAGDVMHMGRMWGLNARKAGPGGGFITPDTIRRDGIPMARDGLSFGLYVWASSPPYSFLQTAPYVSAFNDVKAAVIAA